MKYLTRRSVFFLLTAAVFWAPIKPLAQGLVKFNRSKLYIVGRSGKHEFDVELALTKRQQGQGLMFRRSLPANAGMLFDYQIPTSITMWMKNTFIPLDMIFLGNDGRVTSISQRTIPHSEAVIASRGRARAVLEVNGGTVSRLGIMLGDRVEHPIFGN